LVDVDEGRDLFGDDYEVDDAKFPAGRMNLKALLMPTMLQCRKDAPGVFSGKGKGDCLKRMLLIVDVIKEFIQRVRVAEGFLSAAQLNGGADLTPGTFNYVWGSSTTRMDLGIAQRGCDFMFVRFCLVCVVVGLVALFGCLFGCVWKDQVSSTRYKLILCSGCLGPT